MKAFRIAPLRRLKERTTYNRSILITWLISYLSILLLPIIISGFVYIESTKIVEREINNNNVIMLKQIQKLIDKKIADINRLGLQIAWNPKLDSLLYNTKPMDFRGRFTITQIQKDFLTYKVANGFINDIYVYLHNSDMVINSITSYNIELLESLLDKDERISSSQFRAFSQQNCVHLFTPMKIWQGTKKEEPAIAYIQSLPYGRNNEIQGTMIILLDHRAFLDEILGIEGLQQGIVMMLDQKNQVIAATNPNEQLSGLKYEELHDGILLYKEIADEEYVISSISSQMNEWKYIFALPSIVFMKKVKYIKSLIWCSILLCLFIGGIVAYIFTRKNYNPIQNIIEALASRAGIELNPNLNEYSFIQQAINNTLDEKEIIQEKMEKQKMTLRSAFLARLIKGSSDQIVPIDEALSLYN